MWVLAGPLPLPRCLLELRRKPRQFVAVDDVHLHIRVVAWCVDAPPGLCRARLLCSTAKRGPPCVGIAVRLGSPARRRRRWRWGRASLQRLQDDRVNENTPLATAIDLSDNHRRRGRPHLTSVQLPAVGLLGCPWRLLEHCSGGHRACVLQGRTCRSGQGPLALPRRNARSGSVSLGCFLPGRPTANRRRDKVAMPPRRRNCAWSCRSGTPGRRNRRRPRS